MISTLSRMCAVVARKPKTTREDWTRRARRWVCERLHSWIKRYRALLIRWSKKAENHEALLAFALALITWQQTGILRGN